MLEQDEHKGRRDVGLDERGTLRRTKTKHEGMCEGLGNTKPREVRPPVINNHGQ